VTKEEVEAELDREDVPWRAEVSDDVRELLARFGKRSAIPWCGPRLRDSQPEMLAALACVLLRAIAKKDTDRV
jgi:hypothetical protein